MTNILVLGLNPAYQKIISVPTLGQEGRDVGGVHRATAVVVRVGGKGQNTAKAVSHYHCNSKEASSNPAKVCLAQFVGDGHCGRFVEKYFEEKPGYENMVTVRVAGSDTRTCNTLVGSTSTTEIVEPSAPVDGVSAKLMDDRLSRMISENSPAMVVIAGTAPAGVSAPSVYSEVAKQAQAARKNDAIVILDGYKDVERVLKTGAVTVLKVNRAEFYSLMKTEFPEAQADPSSEQGRSSQLDTLRATTDVFFREYEGVQWLALTDGGQPGWVLSRNGLAAVVVMPAGLLDERAESASPPQDSLSNPIGTGDVVTGVLAAHLWTAAGGVSSKLSIEMVAEGFRRGMAAATSCCLRDEGGVFSHADMQWFVERMSVHVVS